MTELSLLELYCIYGVFVITLLLAFQSEFLIVVDALMESFFGCLDRHIMEAQTVADTEHASDKNAIGIIVYADCTLSLVLKYPCLFQLFRIGRMIQQAGKGSI